MAKTIKFTSTGCCSAIGNFSPGDIARNLPDALADHLVKDAMCAEYLTQPAPAAAGPSDPPAPRRARKAATPATEPKDF